jgi:uncharacterized protein (DUF2141 family)
MTVGARRWRTGRFSALLACALAAAAASASAAPNPPPAPALGGVASLSPAAVGQVIVDVLGLRNDRGQVLGALFRSAQGYPDKVDHSFARTVVRIRDRKATLLFDRIPRGPFAVALHHDENANTRMEKGVFGIPLEGYGASRDAKNTFGPPSYKDAQLTLAAGERKRIAIHVNY